MRDDALVGSILDRFEMMKLRFERDGVWNDDVNIYSCFLTEEKNFHVGMLKYLYEHQCPLVGDEMDSEDLGHLLQQLTSLQQIDILEYMHCKMFGIQYIKEQILSSAIQCQWFEGIKYILPNCEGYDLPSLNLVLNDFDDIEILQYCKSHSMMKLNIETNESFFDVISKIAEKKDSHQFLKLLIFDKDFEIPACVDLMKVALWFDYREDILQLLHDRGFHSEYSMREAVRNNLKVVKFFEDKGQNVNAMHFSIAIFAFVFMIEILSYLIRKKCPQSKRLMDFPCI